MTRLSGLQIASENNQSESLVLSVQAVLRTFGKEVDYDELAVATGAAFMAAASPAIKHANLWATIGRHAFLTSTAALYGLKLRELHPPQAAPLPRAPAEFATHFHDAYQPFIETAIAREKPVLAWMGWPSPASMNWGVITGIDTQTGRCKGHVHGIKDILTKDILTKDILTKDDLTKDDPATDSPVTLHEPPVFVYIVEQYTQKQPTQQELIGVAMQRMATILANQIDPIFKTITGPQALKEWGRMVEQSATAQEPAALGDGLLALVSLLVEGREAALRFFDRMQDAADPTQFAVMAVYSRWFRELVACIRPLCEKGYIQAKIVTDSGRRELGVILEQATEIEKNAAELAT